jgi:glucose/arabinose dehydrogenase
MRVRFWQVSIACLLGVVVAAGEAQSPTSSTPAERPRTRPPSELTGWADWEGADNLLRRIKVPPAPPLEPADALKTFRLAAGYRIELVAAEPMVQSPIFFEFDPDGRIWVVEYQGYMRDLQGRGEGDPICRVVVLEDTNADGRADSSTVFLDGLVMPRSLSFVDGGVLVAEPPNLWLCRDTNRDLRCDEKVRVGTYGRAGNPQHAANGLRYGLDNWLHSADMPLRHRFADGHLTEQPTIHRGQFGVTFDDEGRFLTSRENRPLIADLIPAEYLLRNANLMKAYGRGGPAQNRFGVNIDIAVDARTVFPSRVTPAVTLGALELRPDGRLRTYTVVSGTSFYNGHQFPADAYGNVFVPEAGGHLVGRLKLTGDVDLKASRFYADEEELLTSTDERFRPVNSRVGPDGALYIADMYHGIIEHVIFMVPYLEKQIRERRLEEAPDKGRIYRIVYEENPIDRRPPGLSTAGAAALVSALSDANGWRRLTAQRLLVERRSADAVRPLEDLARFGPQPLGRLHALWTLDGLETLRWPVLLRALSDTDDRVRAGAVRLTEKMAGSGEADRVFDRLVALAGDPSPRVRLQLTLTAGAFHTGGALDLIAKLSNDNPHHLFRTAALTGLGGRELEFLTLWTAQLPKVAANHHLETVRSLAEAIMYEARPSRVEQTLAFLDTQRSAAAPIAL